MLSTILLQCQRHCKQVHTHIYLNVYISDNNLLCILLNTFSSNETKNIYFWFYIDILVYYRQKYVIKELSVTPLTGQVNDS